MKQDNTLSPKEFTHYIVVCKGGNTIPRPMHQFDAVSALEYLLRPIAIFKIKCNQ